jgi:hypothetical protein
MYIYRITILPDVLYRYETRSPTLREKYRLRVLILYFGKQKDKLRVFKNMVLREIFQPKRDEVNGERRRLHNEELHDLYCSLNIIRAIKSRIRRAGHVARKGERRGAYRVLVEKSEEKRHFEGPGVHRK